MVRLSDFDRIIYKRPKVYRYDKPLQKITGFDSEAYRDGSTFMFCTSSGDVITPDILLDTLFTPAYIGSNFVTWNLKYESGAVLKCFPREVIFALQQFHITLYKRTDAKSSANASANARTCVSTLYEISYIPHKLLKIKCCSGKNDKKQVRFWDIASFYVGPDITVNERGSRIRLQSAAETYLKASKIVDIDVSLFTEEYVKGHYEDIAKYCIQDAVLTKELAVLWIDKFQQTGIAVTSLYSEASISFTYISRKAEIVTPYEYWEHNRKLLRYAFESYEGGKFEVVKRGKFTGYEYDISSAYPYEIANLVDIRDAQIEYGRNYMADAVYGFLRVRIEYHAMDVHLPCGLFKHLRLYPMGVYYLTITKQEYDYIKKLSEVSIEIIDAAWIIKYRLTYPYKAVMEELYQLKSEWKKKDGLRSHNYKIIMNGFYGKMAQCIEAPDGSGYIAGQGWNPIYASIITANTRIAVTKLQNALGGACLAVHTDSVITTRKLSESRLGTGLGDFGLVQQGDGIIVACGIYEINKQCALRGFRKGSITDILKENPGKMNIEFSLKHVESWLQAMAQGHPVDRINLFMDVPKILKLNCDTKRQWPFEVTSDDLLNRLQDSQPLEEIQKSAPEYWT